MNFCFTENGWMDYLFWEENDKKTLKKINVLLKDIAHNGDRIGFGKPEPLTGNLSGFFSRRIDVKNRLVYKTEEDSVIILSCRYHHSEH